MNGFDSSTNDPAGTPPGPHAADPFAGTAASASTNDPYAAPGYGYTPGYGAPGPVPPPHPGLPNPGLAAFCGFIPGVGAMYNGQFAKGLAHIVIFAVLVSLADHVNGIFGLLVTGWIFYMVFDAYQTARARRDGLQIPDPFGLNNIGERMGVGNGPNWSDFTAKPVPGQAPPPPPPAGSPYTPGPQSTTYASQTTPYDAQASAYREVPPSYPPAAEPPVYPQGYAQPTAPYGAAAVPPYGTPAYTVPPVQPFAPYAPPQVPPLPPAAAGGLPTGALWLIGLGLFALVGTLSHRFYWSNRFLDGAIVIAIGVAVLITRTLRARTVYPAGTAASTWYVLHSTRAGLILLAIGVGLTLDHVGTISWGDMWPYLLILVGVFLLLERAAHNRMLAAGPVSPMGTAAEADPYATAPPASSSFVPPTQQRDEEGR